MALPQDRDREQRARELSDDALVRELARCRAKERTVKPNKARRSWKLAAEAIEQELQRRGLHAN
jgi:hypothetical protein